MALIDKASLLMVPSTYEDGTLYNVLPSGNKAPDETGNHNGYDQTRADFTFSRGSNLAATRVNANGLIEKGRENVFKHSNAFTTSPWSMSATLTSGQADKDGGTNAWLFAKSGLSNSDYYNDTTINGVQTFSIYAKKQSGVGIKPYFFGSVNGYATINLGDGSKYDASGAIIDYKAEAYNDNWWRISVTINASSGNWYIYVTDGTNTQTTTPITIQNAQLEYGLTASSYLDSGATTATAGVLENTPRIDYSSGAGALLLEPQRTNLFAHSEYLDNWTGGGAITTNTAISPDGLENASTFTTSSAGEDLRDTTNVTGTYVFSIFAKLVDVGGVRLRIDAATDANAYFDLSDGSVYDSGGIIDADAIDYGNNWWRVYIVANVTNTQKIQVFTTDGTTSYANGSVHLFGAQLEAGSYVSSYVPTYGSAATRGADSCSVTGVSDVIGQTEGTIYVDLADYDGNTHLVTLGDGTASNYIMLYISSGAIAWLSSGGFSGSAGSISAGDKAALAYKENDSVLYLNGVQMLSDTSNTIPNIPNIYLNDNATLSNKLHLQTKQVVLFNERLTNEELATLTTL